jgi:hypothetical protein
MKSTHPKVNRQKFGRYLMAQAFTVGLVASLAVEGQYPEWNIQGGIQAPNQGNEQTASLILDIDLDGISDFVITERTQSPSVVWYRSTGKTWERKIIEDTPLKIEAGGDYLDIDRDGDPDIVFGGDARSNQIWWWENPFPHFGGKWERHLIKDQGRNKHHDQLFGDFDHDGKAELVSWNQHDSLLLMFEIPVDPRTSGPWEYTAIYRGEPRDEGLAAADINLDGKQDIVGAGKWFEYNEGVKFTSHLIDAGMNFSRAAAGQLVAGGHPEVVFSPGDADGDAKWYEWKRGRWISHSLGYVVHGHTLQLADLNRDGKQDIFIGEMGNPGDGDKADLMIWYGDGKGHFRKMIIRTGQGIHEGRIGDLNGDRVLDILVKPYNHHSPLVEVMTGEIDSKLTLDRWKTRKVEDLCDRAGIYKHGWFGPTKSQSEIFWCRANGWIVWATAEILANLPADHPQYAAILRQFRTHIEQLVKLQHPGGLWHQVLDHPETYLETSGSAMFVLAIARGIREGWLPRTYMESAVLGWKGISGRISDNGIVRGICRGTPIGHSVEFYEDRSTFDNDPRGLGAVIQAGVEMELLFNR